VGRQVRMAQATEKSSNAQIRTSTNPGSDFVSVLISSLVAIDRNLSERLFPLQIREVHARPAFAPFERTQLSATFRAINKTQVDTLPD